MMHCQPNKIPKSSRIQSKFYYRVGCLNNLTDVFLILYYVYRFATLASLNKDGSSDEEEGQAFFAGGSEHSGQQILGPGKNKTNIVAEMFKTAQE